MRGRLGHGFQSPEMASWVGELLVSGTAGFRLRLLVGCDVVVRDPGLPRPRAGLVRPGVTGVVGLATRSDGLKSVCWGARNRKREARY